MAYWKKSVSSRTDCSRQDSDLVAAFSGIVKNAPFSGNLRDFATGPRGEGR